MPGPADPPRPSLTSTVRSYVLTCTWNQNLNRLEKSGVAQIAWLNQTGAPTTQASVYWEVGSATDAGACVTCKVPQQTHTIIANGTYDSTTGEITHGGKKYRFRFEMVSGVATMQSYAV